jgi:hypothetical protein
MIFRIRWIFLTLFFSATSAAQAATAWTGSFVITQLYISGAENFHVRVSGFGYISACSNGPTWAYINQSQSGSKEYIAALMIAYASGKPVNLFWQPDANGYCQIIEMIS